MAKETTQKGQYIKFLKKSQNWRQGWLSDKQNCSRGVPKNPHFVWLCPSHLLSWALPMYLTACLLSRSCNIPHSQNPRSTTVPNTNQANHLQTDKVDCSSKFHIPNQVTTLQDSHNKYQQSNIGLQIIYKKARIRWQDSVPPISGGTYRQRRTLIDLVQRLQCEHCSAL